MAKVKLLEFPAMDVLAALRVADLQATRDGMPITAKRHREQAELLDAALREGTVIISLG